MIISAEVFSDRGKLHSQFLYPQLNLFQLLHAGHSAGYIIQMVKSFLP